MARRAGIPEAVERAGKRGLVDDICYGICCYGICAQTWESQAVPLTTFVAGSPNSVGRRSRLQIFCDSELPRENGLG